MHAKGMGVPGEIGADAAQAHDQKGAAGDLPATLAEIGPLDVRRQIHLYLKIFRPH